MTPIPGQGSLLDAPTTQGRTRRTDPVSSVTAAKRCRPGSQRYAIALAFRLGASHVTADQLADRDPKKSHRSAWSARLGQLVKEGRLEKGPMVPGHGQDVLSYHLTAEGRAWVADLMERVA